MGHSLVGAVAGELGLLGVESSVSEKQLSPSESHPPEDVRDDGEDEE